MFQAPIWGFGAKKNNKRKKPKKKAVFIQTLPTNSPLQWRCDEKKIYFHEKVLMKKNNVILCNFNCISIFLLVVVTVT